MNESCSEPVHEPTTLTVPPMFEKLGSGGIEALPVELPADALAPPLAGAEADADSDALAGADPLAPADAPAEPDALAGADSVAAAEALAGADALAAVDEEATADDAGADDVAADGADEVPVDGATGLGEDPEEHAPNAIEAVANSVSAARDVRSCMPSPS